MDRLDKCKLALKKGFKYNRDTGIVLGVKGKPIIKKVNGYISLTIWHNNKRNYLFAHQFAWYCEHKEVVELIDHKNQNKTDNKISNLRSTTKQINAYNRKAKGCYFDSRSGKWISHIMVNYIKYQIGSFTYQSDAEIAYKNKKQELLNKLNK